VHGILPAGAHPEAAGRQARRRLLSPRSTMFSRIVLALLSFAALTARAAEVGLDTVTVTAEQAPVERMLDGRIEAVSQGTVSAQTSGRVAEVLYDVNDFVPADAVIIRLRATEQRASLEQAQAALKEAT